MGRRIVLEENRKRFIIEDDLNINPNYFKSEDKYPFLRNQNKCDYIVEINGKVLFIELKGADFEKGISQLENTVKQLQNSYPNCNREKHTFCKNNIAEI